MKVIVIGVGIGGLSVVVVFKQLGIDCDVYEVVKEIKLVGVVIFVWFNGVKCMVYFGMGDIMEIFGGLLCWMVYCDFCSGENMIQFSFVLLIECIGSCFCLVFWVELQWEMLDYWGWDSVQFGKCVICCEEDVDGVMVWFIDGSSVSGDLLIVVDGSYFVLCLWVLGFILQWCYVGYVNWNGLVEIDEVLVFGDQWIIFVGEGKCVLLMLVFVGWFYFFFDVLLLVGLVEDCDILCVDFSCYFVGWVLLVQKLIVVFDLQIINCIEIYDIEFFSCLVCGCVVLFGDVGYSIILDIGQGGCVVMEDVVVLGVVFCQI